MAINNRFGILLAEKIVAERRCIKMLDISRETGIPHKTLHAWKNNTVTRYDAHIMSALCEYFDIQPGKLLEKVSEEK